MNNTQLIEISPVQPPTNSLDITDCSPVQSSANSPDITDYSNSPPQWLIHKDDQKILDKLQCAVQYFSLDMLPA